MTVNQLHRHYRCYFCALSLLQLCLCSYSKMPRLSEFSSREIADIHFYYGLCRGVARAARNAYIEAFPNRQQVPSARNFQEVHRRLSNIGLRLNPDREQQAVVIDNSVEEAVLNDLFADPSTSQRRLATRHGISKTSVWRILKKEGLHAYHFQRVQHLHGDVDSRPRCVLSAWILRNVRDDPEFSKRILWMDESRFTRDGIVNVRNLHEWSYENPRLKRSSAFQVQFSVNVFAGIIDNMIIGPVILPGTLNSSRFLTLIRDELPSLLEDVPLNTRRNMFLQMDGCPAHYASVVRSFLDETYPNRWIGRQGPIAWPARSPDMTPLDYFLWGHLKQRVYNKPINSEAELQTRIDQCFDEVRNNTNMIARATQQIVVRATMCLQQRGGHFEQLF